jgi:hypothetical protein
MRLGRASLALAFLTVVVLGVAGTASAAGTQPVTANADLNQPTTCSTPVQVGGVMLSHCTNDETWTGDISGTGFYSYDRVTSVASGASVLLNGVETIVNACVLDTCGGSLNTIWNEQDLPTGDFHIEQNFQGGTGAFTKAHGSIRFNVALDVFQGHLGI